MHLQRLFFRKLGQNLFPLLVDRFCHQFLTGRIEMNAIKAEFRRKVHPFGDFSRKIDMDLGPDISIDSSKALLPILSRRFIEGPGNILGIDWWQGHKNWADPVLFTFFLDGGKVGNDIIWIHASPQTVGSRHDDEIVGMERQDIIIKAGQGGPARIPALGQVNGIKLQIVLEAVFPITW